MAKWSVLFYMNADHEDYYEQGLAEKVLNELSTVGSNEHLNIMVLLDRFKPDEKEGSKQFSPSIYRVEYNKKITFQTPPLKILPYENMGNPKMLEDFIEFCDSSSDFSAENYILTIWDHGGGYFTEGHWRNKFSLEPNTFFGFNNILREKRNISLQRLYAPFSRLKKNLYPWESGTEDGYLYPSEINDVIGKTIHGKLQVIIFDACWMATFETAYCLKNAAQCIIASENTLSNDGLDYRPLKYLKREKGIKPEDICKLIVTDTASFKHSGDPFATISSYKTSSISSATSLINAFCRFIVKEEKYELLYLSRASCMNFYYDADPSVGLDTIDLLYFFETFKRITEEVEGETEFIDTLVMPVITSLKQLVIVSKAGSEMIKQDDIKKCWGANGISIYFPDNPFYFSVFVNLKEWYFDTTAGRHPFNTEDWKKMLVHYFTWMQTDFNVFIAPPAKS